MCTYIYIYIIPDRIMLGTLMSIMNTHIIYCKNPDTCWNDYANIVQTTHNDIQDGHVLSSSASIYIYIYTYIHIYIYIYMTG